MTTDTPPPAPTDGPVRPPVGRYGPEPSAGRRRVVVVAIGVLAVAALALVAWLGLGYADDPVRWKDIGFSVVDSERVDVTFEVYMAPGTTAVCTVDALSESYAQVGTVDVTVGPLDVRDSRYEVSIGTSELATTGVVDGCRVVE